MQLRLARLRADAARGAATLEYAAAAAIASVLIVALVVAASGFRFEAIAERAICLVKTAVGGGSCAASDPDPPDEPPFDPKPPKCKLGEHTEKVNAEIKIAFIKIGENAGFVETTYSDGSVTYTATDGAEVGLTGGVGGKVDLGKVERGLTVDFGAGVKFDYGSTWTFSDAAEAQAMRDQLDKYLLEQQMMRHNPEGYGLYVLVHGAAEPPKPPSQRVSTVETTLDTTGKLGFSLPLDRTPDSQSGVPNLTLAEAGLKFGGSGKWTRITDTTTGATTWTTAGEVFGQANGQVGPVAGELKGIYGSSMAITRGEDGKITKVALVTTREGKATGTVNSGQKDLVGNASDSDSAAAVTVTTTTLDVTSDEQRALVNAWLTAQENGGAISSETFYPDRLVSGDPFQNLMYTNATVSNVQYSNVTDKSGFAAEVKLGVALGVDFSLETTESQATDATYLDVPGSNGTRPPVTFSECVAQ